MATFYLDPVAGNDANDGTTFANRWQTLTSGATAARIAPGDVIRVIASPGATSMGINATFTEDNQTITLASSVTANVYASGGWTAATTNVTLTTSTNRKLGSNCASISPNATFTTGKAAYLTLASTDFSAYQQVSFWINMTAGAMAADGDIYLALCSDTIGNTVVNTINVPRIRATGQWQAYTVDLGTALGSAIQSIALYIAVDNGAQTFLVNNVLACKASSSADSLTLTSMIGKNTGTDPWMGIQSINGTSVLIENRPQSGQVLGGYGGYPGTTATTTIYKRDVLQLPSAIVGTIAGSTTWGTVQDSGTAGNVITFSGGWNRTDMSTQTGDTYISGVNTFGYALSLSTKSYVTFDKLNFTRFYQGLYCQETQCSNISVTAKDWSAFGATSFTMETAINNSSFNSTFTIDNILFGGINTYLAATVLSYGNTYNIGIFAGFINTTVPVADTPTTYTQSIFNESYTINKWTQYKNGPNSTYLGQLSNISKSVFLIDKCTNNTIDYAFIFGSRSLNYSASSDNNYIKFSTAFSIANINSSSTCITLVFLNGNNNIVDFNNLNVTPQQTTTTNAASFIKVSNNSTGNIVRNIGTLTIGAQTAVVDFSDSSNVTVANVNSFSISGTNATLNRFRGVTPGNIVYSNYNNTITDQRIYYNTNVGNILTDTSVRKTPSGISWKMTVGSATTPPESPTATYPLQLPVATIACNASALVTASVWVYRTSTSLTTKFVCPGGQIAGVASDVSTSASAAINTWEQLTITFTPSAQGVVQLFVQCYGAAASVYVDDFSVTQA